MLQVSDAFDHIMRFKDDPTQDGSSARGERDRSHWHLTRRRAVVYDIKVNGSRRGIYLRELSEVSAVTSHTISVDLKFPEHYANEQKSDFQLHLHLRVAPHGVWCDSRNARQSITLNGPPRPGGRQQQQQKQRETIGSAAPSILCW
jgi:hypothetical protein